MVLDRLNMMVRGVRCKAIRGVSMVGCLFVIASLGLAASR
jgi:hypothetical protein